MLIMKFGWGVAEIFGVKIMHNDYQQFPLSEEQKRVWAQSIMRRGLNL